MTILFWLLPPALVTLGAIAWTGWAARERPESEKSEERFAEAILREHPGMAPRRTTPRERSTGVAVRPTQSPRRSA